MSTITSGATIITPDLVTGYQSTRDSQSLFHSVIGRAYPDVTLRQTSLRRGTLTMLFAQITAEADSLAAETLHGAGLVMTFADNDRASVGMTYVTSGAVVRELEPETGAGWTLSVDYQEVRA